MKENEKREYLESYEEAKKKGIPFFPDALFKDAVVSLLVFVVLILLAAFAGAALDERADPSAEFDPRPEWYFLFIFQLLKYFPGNLEFVGAVLLPIAVMGVLFALPWLDRSRRRHITGRLTVAGVTVVLGGAAVALSIQAWMETPPPPGITAQGDQVAALYTENCAGCHGGVVAVPAGLDLVSVIASGGHQGMPAWAGDLSVEEIDALAGFVLSPTGSAVFAEACSECHDASELVDQPPSVLRATLEPSDFAPHRGITLLSAEERTALLNFLSAPDGQRLFTLQCASCHGSAVPFSGSRDELHEIIRVGGGHLDMPAMGGVLTDTELDTLASYVVDPSSAGASGPALFEQYCTTCHGDRVPGAADTAAARLAIETGGGHETMPVWGEILTEEQLDALTDYTLDAARGTPLMAGQELYAQYCTVCHGEFGEGGANPANPIQVIAPISTASYLQTRDDATIRAIIAQGQPDLGMSPFGLAFGGVLDEEDLDAMVAFIRAWEADPPVELPPEIERAPLIGDAAEVYGEFCAQCHGVDGEGGIGPPLQDPAFQAANTDAAIFNSIDVGHPATPMIAWGQVLSASQIGELVDLIRDLEVEAAEPSENGEEPPDEEPPPPAQDVSFSSDVLPLFKADCAVCHGIFGNWSVDSYATVMESGDSAPVVIPGDPDASLLVELLQTSGERLMPPDPAGPLSDEEIQLVIDWIANGAPDN